MKSKSNLSALVLAVGLVAVGAAVALAHGPGQSATGQPSGWHQGWHMGSCPGTMGQRMGSGMMGQGQMPMMGHGTMGQGSTMGGGTMRQGAGSGMMSQGQLPMMGCGMTGQAMGPGVMGQGQMPMMGHGMMGQGMNSELQPLAEDLSAAQVRHMMEHRLASQGNPNLKIGIVEEKDGDTIVAEIVTTDGSLVQRLEVDRHYGSMGPVQ